MAQKRFFRLEKRFYLRLSFIGRVFLEKWTMKKVPKNGQISPKSKVVNHKFLTILNRFCDFFKRVKKGSFGLEKRFYLGLSLIARIFLEKMDFEKSPQNGQISPKKLRG